MAIKKIGISNTDYYDVTVSDAVFITGTSKNLSDELNDIKNSINVNVGSNGSAREVEIVDNVKAIYRRGPTQGMTIVGENIWLCNHSNDEHTDTASIDVRNIANWTGLDNSKVVEIKHNIGHLNTVDYNKTNNCLITGNGSKVYTNLPMGWIFYNPDQWVTTINVDFFTADKCELDFTHLVGESKAQLCWGENLQGRSDIIYLITNDNKKIRKYLLGKGTTQYDGGVFNSQSDPNRYNGSYKILGEWVQNSSHSVNGDTLYYKGSIYTAGRFSDGCLGLIKLQLLENGGITEKIIKIPISTLQVSDGTQLNGDIWKCSGQGVTRDGNDVYVGGDYYIVKIDLNEL